MRVQSAFEQAGIVFLDDHASGGIEARILVTGVTGQVGCALVARLKGLGTVVPANREILDLSRPEVLSRALDEIAPDLIINPAAYTAVDKAEDEYELALRVHKRQRPKQSK
jgi:dTDP-4-dehydrorhamnose reductase